MTNDEKELRAQIRKGLRILGKEAVALAAFLTLRKDGVTPISGINAWSPCGCFIGMVTVGGQDEAPFGSGTDVSDAVLEVGNGIEAIYDAHAPGSAQRDILRAEVERYLGWRPWEVSVEEASA